MLRAALAVLHMSLTPVLLDCRSAVQHFALCSQELQ